MSDKPRTIYVAEPPPRYRVMPPVVVDSSMLCAVLFDEPEREEALLQLMHRQLLAPTLLSHEIANVALNKLRRGMPVEDVQAGVDDYCAQPVELRETDTQGQWALARKYGLTAYDAAYLWLAADLKVPLATFDRKLAEAARHHLRTLE